MGSNWAENINWEKIINEGGWESINATAVSRRERYAAM